MKYYSRSLSICLSLSVHVSLCVCLSTFPCSPFIFPVVCLYTVLPNHSVYLSLSFWLFFYTLPYYCNNQTIYLVCNTTLPLSLASPSQPLPLIHNSTAPVNSMVLAVTAPPMAEIVIYRALHHTSLPFITVTLWRK